MSLIAKLLPPANVVVDLQASSKKRLFEQAGLLFENQHGVARSLVFDSLLAREETLEHLAAGDAVMVFEQQPRLLEQALLARGLKVHEHV